MGIENFIESNNSKLNQLLKFTAEIDKMTGILRRNLLIDGSRRENDAEHSWHIAVMAILFQDYAPEGCDIGKVVKMCVVHDLVEIYAGDTFAYDTKGCMDKTERELEAAKKLFSRLPEETGSEINELWMEFDKEETIEAKYAACMDRMQPFLHNTLTFGHTWNKEEVSKSQVEQRMNVIKETIPELWPWFEANLQNGVDQGWLTNN